MATKTKAELIQEIEILRGELEAYQAQETDGDRYASFPIPAYTWQRRGDDVVLVDYNEAASKITQGKVSEFIGITAREMYPHRPDIQEDLARCVDEGCSIEREIVYEYMTTGDTRNLALKYAFVTPDLVLVHTEDITERVRAQEEATYERDLMRALLEHIPDYIYFKDKDRRFVRASSSFSDLFKIDLEEILGKRDEDLFPSEIAEETARDDMQVIEKGTPLINKEEGGNSIAGDPAWVITTKLPWYDSEGNIQGLFGVSKDITDLKQTSLLLELEIEERKMTVRKLRSQIELVEDIFNTTTDTIEIFDPESMRYIMWNQAVNEISGYSDKEIAEMDPLRDFIDEPELSEAMRAMQGALDKGEESARTVVISKDGSRTPMDYRLTVTEDAEGDPIHLVAIGRDISEQLRLETALQQSEALYRNMVENISEVIYTLDNKGVVTYLSPAIEPFLGYSPDQLIGESFNKFILPEDLEQARENIGRLMQGETMGLTEYRAKDISGDVRWMRVSSQPIYEEDQVVGFQGVLTDITEVKQAEEKLERAAALAERQRLARELHDSVTQTLYGIDLFAGATQQALSAGKTKEVIGNVRQIQELSQNALGDMRLLIYELQPQIIEEEGLVTALQERLDLVESRSGLSTSIRVVDERPLDTSIEIELYSIATEALNNSLKHSKAEHVGVILEYRLDSVCLTVQDDGIGFEHKNPGVTKGFGLRNIEERAARIGGSISLDSSPGAGTTVKVEVTA